MTQKISIVLLTCVVILVSAVLSGCGESSPTGTAPNFTGVLTGGTTNKFGSLAITGSTSIAFVPNYANFVTVNGSSSITWTYMQLTPYIYTSISIPLDVNGNPSTCSFMHQITTIVGNTTTSTAYWYFAYNMGAAIPGITVNQVTKTVVFNNVVLKGGLFTANASDSVTFNGTLKY